MLDEVDPFYRYECEIRRGTIEELSQEYLSQSRQNKPESFVAFRQKKDNDITMVLHVIPRCAESYRLKPITFGMSVRAEPDTEVHAALQEFIQYGIPPQNIQAEIKDVQSPPGGPLPITKIGRASCRERV